MTVCKACKARIVWARVIGTNAMMPLDARPQAKCYRLNADGSCGPAGDDYHVTHFATCPYASRFSASASPPHNPGPDSPPGPGLSED